MFNWKTHPDKQYRAVSIVCKEKYQVTRCKAYRNGEPISLFVAWPPDPPRPPSYGFYNYEDYVQTAIGYYEMPETAKQACWNHYQEKLNARAPSLPGRDGRSGQELSEII
jgi:hypothetical protein